MLRAVPFLSAVILIASISTLSAATPQQPQTDYQRIIGNVDKTTSTAFGQPVPDANAVDATSNDAAAATALDAAPPAPMVNANAQTAGSNSSNSAQTAASDPYSPKNISIYGQPQFHQSPGISALAPPVNQDFGSRTYNSNYASTAQQVGAVPAYAAPAAPAAASNQ